MEEQAPNHRRRRVILWICLGFLIIAFISFLLWFFWFSLREYTDDAYVGGNRVLVKSQVTSYVAAFYADDNDFVQEGQLLVALDTTPFVIELEKQKKSLAVVVREIRSLAATLKQDHAEILVRQAELQKAEDDYQRRKELVTLQGVSIEDLEHSEIALEMAKAAVISQEEKTQSTLANVGIGPIEEHPSILEQKAVVRKAYVDLVHCHILAPATGFVARRNVQVGDFALQTNTLMSIIPREQMWIEANYKETQLRHMRLEQPVQVRVDLYGRGKTFHGKVTGILAGTGSAFSLIPPQNATGNWIKIVQRVPVRIQLDPEDIDQFPLRIGLSCETYVNTTNREGEVLRPPHAPSPFVDHTNVFTLDFAPLEVEMDAIVAHALTE